MRPLIGVLPLFDKDTKNIWINPKYMYGLEAAGAAPILLTLSASEDYWRQLCSLCDGFLFTGGPDVEPTLYGHEKIPECGYILPARDDMELWMLRELLDTPKPILGICRGVQLLNVAAGGTMYQDLATQRPGSVDHNQAGKTEFNVPTHSLSVTPGTRLAALMGGAEFRVNSMHHQAIWDVAAGLQVCARAEDGLVEAVESTDGLFRLGVQWHPEFLWEENPAQLAIFQGLVNAC